MQVTQDEKKWRENMTLELIKRDVSQFRSVLFWVILDGASDVDVARAAQSLCSRFLSNECGDNSQ